jgi:hypothetical protein
MIRITLQGLNNNKCKGALFFVRTFFFELSFIKPNSVVTRESEDITTPSPSSEAHLNATTSVNVRLPKTYEGRLSS